jgi:hypothetical protein
VKGTVEMRKLKIALFVISAAISLFSLRDKAVVTTVPNTNPPVAEAYHAPAWMQPQPVSAENLIMPSTIVRAPPQAPSAEFAESNLLSQESYIAGNEPTKLADANITPSVPVEELKALPAASPPATVIYGFGGMYPSSDINSEGSVPNGGGTSNQQSVPGPGQPGAGLATAGSVFVTSLAPNSGIPGTVVVIQGAGFNSTAMNNDVKFGSVSSASVTYVSANQLRATVPQSGVSPGSTNVSVTVNSVTSNKALFSVLKSSPGNVFMDNTQARLPPGLALSDSSVIGSGDVDNDNDLDMFIVDTSAGLAYLLINNGQGSFANETSARLPAMSGLSLVTDAALADVNKDGYPDIALVYSSGQTIRLLLNDGHGNFSNAPPANLPVLSTSAAALDMGDANGDGYPDIIIANTDAKDALLINDGTGVFTKDANFNLPAVIDGSSDIRFSDVNRDGAVDIITTNNDVVGASSIRNRVYINNGQGQFTDSTTTLLPEDTEYSEKLDCGDIERDGDIDIIVANYSRNALLINNGSGTFQDQAATRLPTNDLTSNGVKLGDMNGDGYTDIVILGNDNASLLLNDGYGSFMDGDASIKLPDYKSSPGMVGGRRVQIADINGDGCLDIIIGGNSLYILVNSADDKAPVLDHIGDRTAQAGNSLTFNINASDPNGDTLTYLAQSLPAGATFNSILKLFSWTPTPADVGQHTGIRFIVKEDKPTPLQDSEDIAITVTAAGGRPVIDYYVPDGLDLDLTLGQIVQFGIHATDPEGKTLTFKWFLNGVEIPADSGATSSIIFIVPRIGGNTVEARVSNSFGATSLQWNLTVGTTSNHPPSITSFNPNLAVVNIGLPAGGGFSFGVTATDPDLDILSYTWKFNNVAFPPSSDANLSSSAFISSIGAAGDYPLEVSVSDGHNAAVKHSWTIHVTQGSQNQPPSITSFNPNLAVVNIGLPAGGGLSFGVTATDPDLDTLSYTWKFNNVAFPPSSDASLSSSAFMGSVGAAGDYPLEVSVSDGLNAAVKHSWTIHVTQGSTNHAPVAVDDLITVNTNISTDIGVLANDYDPDGNTISISSFTQPSYGTTSQVSGKVRYVPAADYAGSDSFTYRITDGLLISNVATVNVTIKKSVADQLIKRAFSYFWNETDNPETGFVRDRLLVDSTPGVRESDTRYNMASMAATGFGLAAMCVAHSDPDVRGTTVTPEDIEARVDLIMNRLLFIQGEQKNDPAKWGKDGFFYHYVNIAATGATEAGERWTEPGFTSELSTIDTAILVAGVLTAGDYFGGDIMGKALQIYSNVNWPAFLDTNPTVTNGFVVANPHYNQMYMEWKPEYATPAQDAGRRGHWDYNNEGLLIYLLAAAAPVDPAAPIGQKHNIPHETFYAIRRELGNYGKDGTGNPMVKSPFGALFTYQYTQAFFDFKDVNKNALYDAQGVDWWENSVEATRANKRYCNDHAGSFANDMDIWGLTSGYVSGGTYVTYGAPPAGVVIPSDEAKGADGTVFPAAAGGSIAMLPEECLRALDKMRDVYDSFLGRGVWGDYGFANSFRINTSLDNLHFISNYYCGIDMGITLVMAENNRTRLVWDHFSNFDIGGTPLKDKIVGLMGFSTDNACNVKVDDTGGMSGFRMGKLDANNPSFEVKFDLTDIQSAPYLLTIHSYMDTSLLDHTVTVTVKVNDGDPFDVDFKYLRAGKTADLMQYIPIDHQDLKPNDANTITLQYKGIAGDSRARWLAWKNIEISGPAEHNTWAFARDDEALPKVIFGNEYRVDDTYFIGANIASFEQAINKDVENFTDILFYTTAAQADYAALVLKVLETDKDIDTHVQVFAGGAGRAQAMIFDGPLRTAQQITTSGYAVQSGWNRITIYHPGLSVNDPLAGEWIRWDSLELIKAEPPQLSAPQDVGAAAFGNDKIKLRWKAVNYAAKYSVYRSETPKSTYDATPIAVVTSTSYTDSGLQTGKSYYYVVKAAKENDPSGDSQNSAEVGAPTGSYRLDYGDGHDPNAFAGNTLDTLGAPLAPAAAYAELVKYDGTIGKVRKATLNGGEKNIIELKGTDISDATIFSLRVRSDVAGAKFQMKLKDIDGGQASVSIVSPTSDLWQNLLFYFGSGKQLDGVDLHKIDKLEITSETAGRRINIYIDEVDFNIITISGATMDVRIIDGASGAQAASIDFGSTTFDVPKVLAKQYIKISDYKSSMISWGMQIYTDNLAADASPRFTGSVPEDPGDVRVNGLIGTSNSGYRVPVIWQVWDHAKGYYNGTETPEYDTNGLTIDKAGNDGDRAEFAFMMDLSDGDWSKDKYSPNFRTLINSSGELGAPVPFSDTGKGYWPTKIAVGNTLYVYLAVDYTGAPAQRYTTNKITIEIIQKL